jgi:hypothetical protein
VQSGGCSALQIAFQAGSFFPTGEQGQVTGVCPGRKSQQLFCGRQNEPSHTICERIGHETRDDFHRGAVLDGCITVLRPGNSSNDGGMDRVSRRQWRHQWVPGFLCNRFCRQAGPCSAHGGGAERGRLCQHLERALLPQRPAATGGFLIALQDTTDKIVRFGPTKAEGNAGGTGIAIYNGYLYAETNDRVVRYQLPASGIEPTAAPQTVVSGLPLTGDHPMHPIAIDAHGNLYVDLGSATNSCQSENRMPNVPGENPCTELERRAGIWRYDRPRCTTRRRARLPSRSGGVPRGQAP